MSSLRLGCMSGSELAAEDDGTPLVLDALSVQGLLQPCDNVVY